MLCYVMLCYVMLYYIILYYIILYYIILYYINPFSVMKTFKTHNCMICNNEKLQILKFSKSNPNQIINSRSEIYGACRHNTHFHRYKEEAEISADESTKDKKVKRKRGRPKKKDALSDLVCNRDQFFPTVRTKSQIVPSHQNIDHGDGT